MRPLCWGTQETLVAKTIKRLRKIPTANDTYSLVPVCEKILELWRRTHLLDQGRRGSC